MKMIVLSLCIVFFAGCSTTTLRMVAAPKGVPRYVYPGTIMDAELVAAPVIPRDSDYDAGVGRIALGVVVGLLDMPFSFIVDTILLPTDIYRVTAGGKTCRRKEFGD